MNPYSPPRRKSVESDGPKKPLKRNRLLEALAAGLMVIGAFALVYTLFPWINPTQYRMNSGSGDDLIVRTFVGANVTAVLLGSAFLLNRQSPSKRRANPSAAHSSTGQEDDREIQ